MFAWAAAEQIPIFTHCTSAGFQAKKGYGLRCDPFFWAKVLDKYPNLRLCFGHAGGEEYWFSEAKDDASHTDQLPIDQGDDPPRDVWFFGKQVVDLVMKYENVYMDMGYHENILFEDGDKLLLSRFNAVLSLRSINGAYRVGDRIIYGTDWHMIHKERDYRSYLAAFDQVIQKVDNGSWRQPFFATNAARCLLLRERLKDPIFSKQRAVWEAVVAPLPE